MQRRVEAEILDDLAADDPEAIGSRRELYVVNGIMGNHRWLGRRVKALRREGDRVLELGAGDGGLGARLVKQDGCDAERLWGMDLAPRPTNWPQGAHWRQGDIFAAAWPEAEIVIANLFLHHFTAERLRGVGQLLPASCRVLLCREPARRRLHLAQAALLSAVAGFGRVTRHDMPVSIRAGFLGRELPDALGLSDWRIDASTTVLGAYQLAAYRI